MKLEFTERHFDGNNYRSLENSSSLKHTAGGTGEGTSTWWDGQNSLSEWQLSAVGATEAPGMG